MEEKYATYNLYSPSELFSLMLAPASKNFFTSSVDPVSAASNNPKKNNLKY